MACSESRDEETGARPLPDSFWDTVERVSLVYIFAPVFLFLYGWFKFSLMLPVALVIGAALIGELVRASKCEPGIPDIETSRLRSTVAMQLLAILAIICILTLLSGWGIKVKGGDFRKHMSFLRDFMEYSWPIAYSDTGDNHVPGWLTAYFGFYLVPAALGKLFGWYAAFFGAYAWVVLGVFLSVLWFFRVLGVLSIRYALLFLSFGVLHFFAWLFVPGWAFQGDRFEIDYWSVHFVEHTVGKGFTGGFFWGAPCNMWAMQAGAHHALPGWIVLLMILYDSIHRRTSGRTLFLAAPVPIFSSFFAIGLLPFVAASLVISRFKNVLTFRNLIAGPLLVLMIALFISSNNAEFPYGPLWQWQDIFKTWQILAVFYAVEFGIFMAVCWIGVLKPQRREFAWFNAVALAMFVLLPWYRVGHNSELTVKGVLPALLVFLLYLASTIRANYRAGAKPNAPVRLLIVLLLVGSLSAFSIIMLNLQSANPSNFPPDLETVRHINTLDREEAKQLFSDGQSIFWRQLSPPVQMQ